MNSTRRPRIVLLAALLLPSFALAIDEIPAARPVARSIHLKDLLEATSTDPIKVNADSPTLAKFAVAHREWMQKRYGEALTTELREAKITDPEKKAQQLIAWWTTDRVEDPAREFATAFLKEFPAEAPAPFAQALAGNMANFMNGKAAAEPRWQIAMEQTKEGRGQPLYAALAASKLCPNGAAEKRLVELLGQAFPEGQFTDEDGPYVAFLFDDSIAKPVRKAAADRLLPIFTKAALPSWVQLYTTGVLEVDLAWKARGDGYADTVKEDGWEGFAEHLEKARAALTESWKLHPTSPQAAGQMISVVMGGGGTNTDSMRLWFDRAVAAQFDYDSAYDALAWGLRPRWGGSHEQMLAFATACAQTERFDTKVPGKFFEVVSAIADESEGNWRPLLRDKEISALYMHLRQGELADSKKRADRRYVRSALGFLAISAFQVGDSATAIATLDELKDADGRIEVPMNAHRFGCTWGIDWWSSMLEARIEVGPAGAAWKQAAAARAKNDFPAALNMLNEAAEKAGDLKAHVEERQQLVRFERDFAGGAWTELPPHPMAWHRTLGRWSWKNDRLTGSSSGTEMSNYTSLARLGEHFEIRGTVSLERKGRETARAFGICLGHDPLRTQKGQEEYCVYFPLTDATHVRALIGERRTLNSQHRDGKTVDWKDENDFRVLRDGQSVSAWINDQQVLDAAPIPELLSGEGAFGLQMFALNGVDLVHFSKLEARNATPK